MLCDIIAHTIANEADMVIVEITADSNGDFAAYARRKRIDVVIFSTASQVFNAQRIDALLQANPRLGLLEVDGSHDRGTLHHLVPTHDAIGALEQPSLTSAIRAGAALRRR